MGSPRRKKTKTKKAKSPRMKPKPLCAFSCIFFFFDCLCSRSSSGGNDDMGRRPSEEFPSNVHARSLSALTDSNWILGCIGTKGAWKKSSRRRI